MSAYRRRQKLIRGSFQLQFVTAFVAVAAMALLLQFLVLGFQLVRTATELDGPGGDLAEQVPSMLLQVFGVSMGLLMPLLFAVGIFLTFRVAGPIYRFERFLTEVVEGRETRECGIRKGDRLQSLCDLLNRATEEARARNAARETGDAAPERRDLRRVG
jgi:hypothetical protein